MIQELQRKIEGKKGEIVILENEKCVLEDKFQQMENSVLGTKNEHKSYSANMRMMVFDAIVNQVPTGSVPKLIEAFARRCNVTLEAIPHRSTVESMARELGVISDFQSAEALFYSKDVTLSFDATTQEHVHVNEIHFTTENNCYSIALDELPGGTASDYATHIIDSVDNSANVFSHFNSVDFQETRAKLIDNIANTLTDRCASNHAAIRSVSEEWGKSLNELNCHLHPLDSVSTKVRSALKNYEIDHHIPKKILGSDCLAGNLVVQINKLRYKNGKGDPCEFVVFLDDKKLPRGILPRYRGNRLHIFFHLCCTLVQYHSVFTQFFEAGTSCGGLRSSILADFSNEAAHVELQVVGLIGKLLTGPWMVLFYTCADNQINHIDGIYQVKAVIAELRAQIEVPLDTLRRSTDFFGKEISMADATFLKLREPPKNESLFQEMMTISLQAAVDVLERQYKKYFDSNITEQFKTEANSARSHNIDSEQMMGMFSAAQKKAPAATLYYISSKLRAQKNKTVEYLDSLEEERRESIIKKAVNFGEKQKQRRKSRQKDLTAELSKRQADKQQKRDTTERNKLEKKLKSVSVDDILNKIPEVKEDKLEDVKTLLNGKAIGWEIAHVWYNEGKQVMYKGKINRVFRSGKQRKYEVAYWDESGTYADAVDYEVSVFALAADYIMDDLVL